jgi:hypothetical protein
MSHYGPLLIGVLVIVIAYVAFMQKFFDDGIPVAIALGVAAFSVFVLPKVPHSPVACLSHKATPCTGSHLDAVMWAAFVVPLIAAVLYKMRRGDKRGVTGSRSVFRRGRR